MTSLQQRLNLLNIIDEAILSGASLTACSREVNISKRTLFRWRKDLQSDNPGDKRPTAIRPTPSNALSEAEEQQIVDTCNSPRFASATPAHIVNTLMDENIYYASESSFYRILSKRKLNKHRGRARKPAPPLPKTNYTATAPNQVWAWDITWLPSSVAGIFYKLYFIMDIYSRKIIASEVFAEENAENSKILIRRACLAENIAIQGHTTILHGDNGSPLKASTVHALMHQLGITPSHSRPRVSNDNAFAEALFRTTKYHPSYPHHDCFNNIQQAGEWRENFVKFYNHSHKHRALNFVTPEQKHSGQDIEILKNRKLVLEEKKSMNSKRWINNKTRNCDPTTQTNLHPIENRATEKHLKKSA